MIFLHKLSKQFNLILTLLILSMFMVISTFAYPQSILAASANNSASSAGVTVKTLAPGSKYATELYIVESGKPGPVVMIVGGVHGSETAGYTAAAKVKNWTIDKGTLLVLPQANRRAIEKHVREIDGEGNLNRLFPDSSGETPKHPLASAIWSAIRQYDVDWLMDMHEGIDYSKTSSSVGQSLIYYPNSATKKMTSNIAAGLNQDIKSSSKKFSLFDLPIKGSLARAAGQFLGVHSFIFETCDNPSLSVRVNFHLQAAQTLLRDLDMI